MPFDLPLESEHWFQMKVTDLYHLPNAHCPHIMFQVLSKAVNNTAVG
jgi:hypothetical protein